MFIDLAKISITFGVVLIVLGSIFWLLGKLPFAGKLPGDIQIKGENFTLYAPVATMILLSIILSIILTIIANLRK